MVSKQLILLTLLYILIVFEPYFIKVLNILFQGVTVFKNCLIILMCSVGLFACSSINPTYIAKSNTYVLHTIAPTTVESVSLIYTYNTTTLEHQYENSFCTNLVDCSYNINNIKNATMFDGFDLTTQPIQNNKHGIKTIDLYRILYTTPGQNGESEIVSGSIYYPNTATNKIKGIILFFHPTFFAKSSVSSSEPNNKVNRTVAAIFTSQGYIVVAPDYIGMGYNKKIIHPYVLYPQVNAIDGLSILKASHEFLSTHNMLPPAKNNKIPLFVTGYSEGSSYALWFSRLYQEQTKFKNEFNQTNFDLKLVVPISGAYDLSGVIYNFLFSNNNTFNSSVYKTSNSLISGALKPSLSTNALMSYAYYSESGNYSKVFNPDFFNMNCTLQLNSNCEIESKQFNLQQILYVESKDVIYPIPDNSLDIYIVNKINNAATYKVNNGRIFTFWTNSVLPLVNPDLRNDIMLQNLLSAGNVYYWHSDIPTTLITLSRDSVVSPINTEYAYRGMMENNSTNLHKIEVDNSLIRNRFSIILPDFEVDHLTGFFYLFIVAEKQFDATYTQ